MAIFGFVGTTISGMGGDIDWLYVAVATVSFILIYTGKNAFVPSISIEGEFSFRDFLSGLFIAIGMGISSAIASIVASGKIMWPAFWLAIGTAVLGYFTKTLPAGKKTG